MFRTPAAKRAAFALAAAIVLYLLFFHGLTGTGLLGPDEPRYAAIGREMARSGDWITPRLWGRPWFEKPPLLYWMTAAAFSAGLGPDLAPRLPVAILSVAFLLFYYVVLRREGLAPFLSTVILGTTAGWLAYSHTAVTDLPMTAAFSAAMLLALPWIDRGDRRVLPGAAALLGLAVLAKGLVPLALALPAAWMGRRRLRDLLRPAPVAAFLIVAAPWYIAVIARHGWTFIDEFFIKQHFERLATETLQHVQPFWFYAPVLLAGLFPWIPLVPLACRTRLYADPKRRFLLLWIAFGFVFFSVSKNKLPGYMLPLFPPAAALLGAALEKAARARAALIACALLLAAVPAVAAMLPGALLRGVTRTAAAAPPWPVFLPVAALATAVWLLDRASRRAAAVCAIALAMAAAAAWIAAAAYPALDRTVSARGVWREIEDRAAHVCVGDVNRGWRYNLNYYSDIPLPACAGAPRPVRIEQNPEGIPRIISAGAPEDLGQSPITP